MGEQATNSIHVLTLRGICFGKGAEMSKRVFLILATALAMLMLAGCGKTVVPEGADYSYFMDLMVSQETGTITELHDATLKALKSLELPVSYDKKDNLVAVVQTFTAEGQSVKILIEYRSLDVTQLTLSSPDDVDQYKLSGLLEEIRRNMSVI
jgi:hypothetical protein